MRIISNVSHRLPLILGFICLNLGLLHGQETIVWGHNNTGFSPTTQSTLDYTPLPNPTRFSNVSQETFGGGVTGAVPTGATWLVISNNGLLPDPGYASYSFTSLLDQHVPSYNWSEHTVGAIVFRPDPDTGVGFTPHTYNIDIRISSDDFVTSDLLGSETIVQGHNIFTSRVGFTNNFPLSAGTDYDVRVYFLGPVGPGSDPSVVWDDFRLNFDTIPEVSTTMLLGLGGLLLALKRRR